MGVGQRVGDVVQDPDHFAWRELHALVQGMTQRFSLDVRHREVQQVARRPGRVQRNDMGMLQLGRELDLPPKPLTAHPRGELGRQHLHDHLPVQRLLERHKHPAHATAGQLTLEDVIVAERLLQFGCEAVETGHGMVAECRLPFTNCQLANCRTECPSVAFRNLHPAIPSGQACSYVPWTRRVVRQRSSS